MKTKKSTPLISVSKFQKIVPTFLGTLVLLIVTGLLSQVFISGVKTDNSQKVLADATETATFFPHTLTDYANEDGSLFSQPKSTGSSVWFGNGQSITKSYLGIRFSGATIPKGAQIVSANLEFISKQTTWISTSTSFGAEFSGTPQSYSSTNRPSTRILAAEKQSYQDNVQWLANSTYKYDISRVIQSLGSENDRSIINVIVQGKATQSWGRKFIVPGTDANTAAKLIIVYHIAGTSSQPSPTMSMGSMQPTATKVISQPLPTSVTGISSSGGLGGNAASYGQWDPNSPTYASTGPQKYPNCTKAFHDSFFVIGPDGKKYPTWHPPVAVDPATGIKCTFGHEHGDDPSKSAIWEEAQQHFYYDANHNGVMDPAEKAVAGIPFGYANEQLDVYAAAKGLPIMRHEAHPGHKLIVGNGEADTDGGSFNTNTTGGIVIPIQHESNGFKWTNSGASCYYLEELHMGVSSPDAFGNNLHEIQLLADCKGPTTVYNQKVAVDVLAQFGAPGEFTTLCTPIEDRTTPIVIGKTDMNKDYPGTRGNGGREIIPRSCLEKFFLVPEGQFSQNLYEEWDASPRIKTASGKELVSGLNLAIDVEESMRYYDPAKPNAIGYSVDLCYEVLPNGNRARGGTCSGIPAGVTFNSTLSPFKGLHRGMYLQGPTTDNLGGPEYWYTDPFGNNAQTTPFPGSIRQQVSSTKANYGNLGPIDPRQIDKQFDDGENTVHAPN